MCQVIPGTRYNPATDAYEWKHDPAGFIVSMKPDRVAICLPPADEGDYVQIYWMDLMSALRLAHAILHAQPLDLIGGGAGDFWSFWVSVTPVDGGLTLSTRDYGPATDVFLPATQTRALSDAIWNATAIAGNAEAARDPGWHDILKSVTSAMGHVTRLGVNDGFIKAFLS